MESPVAHNLFHRRPIIKSKTSAVKWVREWVTQHVVATGGRCTVLRWVREDTSKTLKENEKEPEVPDPEPAIGGEGEQPKDKESVVPVENLPLESKLQMIQEQRLKMKLPSLTFGTAA